MKRIPIYFSLIVNLTPLSASAQTSSLGGLAGSPLRMGFGARGIALANAMSAVTTGDALTYYNPALAPFQDVPFGTAAYGLLSLDRALNFVSFGQSLKPSAGIAFGIINSGVSNIEGRDRDGIRTETYSTSENSFFFSFGIKVEDKISLGVSAKLLYYSLFREVSSSTVGFDLGFLYQLSDELAFGAVMQDINSKYIWDTSKLYGTSGNRTVDYFPLRKKIGLTYFASDMNLLLATELEFISNETFLRCGGELSLADAFQLRAGLDQVSLSSSLDSKPSFGVAFSSPDLMWRPAIQYTFVLEPYSPHGIHIFSLSVHFE